MLKKKSGITLIALVITVVILLVLAGVVVNLSLGENGIIGKAKTAVDKYKQASQNEEMLIAKIENEIDSYVGGNRDYELEINKLKDRITELENVTQNTKNTMSGTEHFTGEYYLDGKPIYERTFYIASLPASSTATEYNHGITGVDKIWLSSNASYVKHPTDEKITFPFPMVSSNNSTIIIAIVQIDNSSVHIRTDGDRRTWSAYITLRYTKTTDSATITPNVTTLTVNP